MSRPEPVAAAPAAWLGEAPFWDESRRRLWWVDIAGRQVCWLEPETGRAGAWRTPAPVSAVVPSRQGDLVLALADGASSGPAETRARYAIHRAGLPAPITQLHVYDHGELFAMLDFAWPDLKVWVEFDGKVKYEKYLRDGETPGDAVFREKKREDRLRELTGWRCLRITWADLEHPERWIGKLRQMLGLAAA